VSGDPRLSSTVGEKYRVVRFIAEGGMGAVYEAQHLFVRRRFAIKFLHRDLAHRRDVLARFTQEARAAGALEHENIAAVVDFGVAGDGAPYLVMEYLDGADLACLLALAGPLPSERAADLVLQAALGVQVAHAASLIHRDLKPQNLFLCRRSDGTDLVKLLDFGVAKLQTPEGAVTRTGAMLGTPAYMSPEQARGESTLDERIDIYALGVILYELLSGHTPHPGDSHNAVIHHIATQSFVPLTSAERELPRPLIELVHRTLSASPALRPATAAELVAALRPFARRSVWPDVARSAEPGTEPTLLAGERGKGPEQSVPVALLDSRARAQRPGASALGAGVIGVGAVGLAAVVVWLATHLRPVPPPEVAPTVAGTTERAGAPSPGTVPAPAAPPGVDSSGAQAGSAPSVASSVVESTPPARPLEIRERPKGRPLSPRRAAKAPPKAIAADETGVSFDDSNPYE
jgi:eukaryotic-like serine/threonine-protein kinase